VRQASACAVRVGLWAPLVPITEAPRMPRLATSCAKPKLSTTLVSRLSPCAWRHRRERQTARDSLLLRQLGASGRDQTAYVAIEIFEARRLEKSWRCPRSRAGCFS
jgi:hypothetical protein